jgi:hypothetical protein
MTLRATALKKTNNKQAGRHSVVWPVFEVVWRVVESTEIHEFCPTLFSQLFDSVVFLKFKKRRRSEDSPPNMAARARPDQR